MGGTSVGDDIVGDVQAAIVSMMTMSRAIEGGRILGRLYCCLAELWKDGCLYDEKIS
jgi:hypothetical protein